MKKVYRMIPVLMLLLMLILTVVPALAVDDDIIVEASVDGVSTTASVLADTSNASPVLIIAYITVFALCLVFLAWLILRGKLKTAGLGIIKSITGAVSTLTTTIAAITPNKTDDTIALVMQLVEKAVYAAENMFYNEEITADERYAICMKYFDEMLAAASISLTEAQRNIIDTLIKAACESLGHTVELSEAVAVALETETKIKDNETAVEAEPAATVTKDPFNGTDEPVQLE